MELNVFMRELESALVQRGIPDETALRHVSNLRRTFTNEDLSEIQAIQSSAEINQLADSIAAILNKNRRTAPAPEVLPPENEPDAPLPAAPSAKIQPAPQTSVRPADEIPYDDPAPEPPPRRQQPARSDSRSSASPRRREQVDDYFEYAPDAAPSTKGMILFWVGLFITLPLTLGIVIAMFAVFAVLFVVLSALIVASIIAVIGVVAAGAVASLVAIIFGITQLFGIGGGTVIAGIYEIGLGVMVAGLVLFVSVLLYNFAIRFLPWVISKLGTFLRYLCGKLKDLFLYVRRECYQL